MTNVRVLVMLACVGCAGPSTSRDDGAQHGQSTITEPTPVPAEAQRTGDPGRGYDTLINFDYVTCGVPYTAYARVYGPASSSERIPGRNALNADIPYYQTRFISSSGVDLVTANCLFCHASHINGQLVMGLGNSTLDFTSDRSAAAELAGSLVSDERERIEWRKWADRVQATGPYLVTRTVGVNPADNLASILFAHRDRDTLAWSDRVLMEPPPLDPIVVDVPAWWLMKKKNAMFYAGVGRGDHARIMMSASALCTDTLEEAERIDARFNDVRAFIASIEAPHFPFAMDDEKAARGKAVFERTCARCHGTYGEGGAYPNLVVPVEMVGTDATVANSGYSRVSRFVDWFNNSFYGETARLEGVGGYIAPPLDGVWATAPYLHNGSVPTVEALLKSSLRPTYWTRSFDTRDYDPDALGWIFEELDHGQAGETDDSRRKRIYDTTFEGYSNAGHTFGDVLGDDERSEVIEYLKTL